MTDTWTRAEWLMFWDLQAESADEMEALDPKIVELGKMDSADLVRFIEAMPPDMFKQPEFARRVLEQVMRLSPTLVKVSEARQLTDDEAEVLAYARDVSQANYMWQPGQGTVEDLQLRQLQMAADWRSARRGNAASAQSIGQAEHAIYTDLTTRIAKAAARGDARFAAQLERERDAVLQRVQQAALAQAYGGGGGGGGGRALSIQPVPRLGAQELGKKIGREERLHGLLSKLTGKGKR